MSFLQFTNTMTREVGPFHLEPPATVRLYTCGPTVYNFAHIGNFRTYLFEDLLRRTLTWFGYGVHQVMNLTDVEDKIIHGCNQKKIPLREFTDPFIRAFFEDLETLGIEKAEAYPRATDYISQMIAIIEHLIAKGIAYKADDGSVYYAIDRFERYGALAHLDADGLKAGARISSDEYDKGSARDFALWKAWDEADGDVAWDSPFGRGRPGWHIECSAMSMSLLGETFDIHTGGVDNIFPHHENEIAQSEGATGKPFVKLWMHSEHLLVENRKMSKSLGNFFTLRDLLARGYKPLAIRFLLLSTHYRSQLNFTFASLDAAAHALERIHDLERRLRARAALIETGAQRPGPPASGSVAGPPSLPTSPSAVARPGALRGVPSEPVAGACKDAVDEFRKWLGDDLNVSGALAAVFDLVTEVNRLDRGPGLTPADADAVLEALESFDHVFGFLAREAAGLGADARGPNALDAETAALLEARAAARQAKNFQESDRLRDLLKTRGVLVEDTRDGQLWRKTAS